MTGLPWNREVYETGGWTDGRLGQAYDLIRAVLMERGARVLWNPLLEQIEKLDAEKSALNPQSDPYGNDTPQIPVEPTGPEQTPYPGAPS